MPLPSKTKLAEEYLSRAISREVKGLAVYGEFDAKSDKRIMAVEAQEEALDVYVYLKMLKMKFPKMKPQIVMAQRDAFALYCSLRKLEQEERENNGRGSQEVASKG